MFYDRLKTLCIADNLKITRLVKDLEMSAGNVKKWGNGSFPNGDTLIKFSRYFNVTTDYLLGLTDIPQKDGYKLTRTEEQLINDYRNLNTQGQELIRQIMHSTLNTYKKLDSVSDMEKF